MENKKLEDKKLVMDGYCFICGGNGFLHKDCPSCGREARDKSLNLDCREDTAEFVQKVSVAGVPDVYRGIVWDADILKESKPDKHNDYSFINYVKELSAINSVFARGLLPGKSAIIIAPAGYSKMVFAYSCMQHALDNGFSVAPILDTVELKRFLTLAGDNPLYKACNSLNYDEYIMSDVLFVTVTKLPAREWAYQVIQELIDRRARKGLSTFILSRYTLGEISKKDYSNQFSAIATAISSDGFKYPAIIRYRELQSNVEECC